MYRGVFYQIAMICRKQLYPYVIWQCHKLYPNTMRAICQLEMSSLRLQLMLLKFWYLDSQYEYNKQLGFSFLCQYLHECIKWLLDIQIRSVKMMVRPNKYFVVSKSSVCYVVWYYQFASVFLLHCYLHSALDSIWKLFRNWQNIRQIPEAVFMF